ncbi:MAG: hypothetical protein V3V18_09635 [Methylococcales bacterium]
MSKQLIVETQELFNAIFKCCLEKTTGTFFVATEDNRSCQIVIEQGIVTSSSFSERRGFHAIIELQKLKTARFSFSKNLILPMDDSAKISDSVAVLKQLGFERFVVAEKKNHAIDLKTQRKAKAHRIYRGQPIYDTVNHTETQSDRSINNKGSITKKPVRMYRGQIVND